MKKLVNGGIIRYVEDHIAYEYKDKGFEIVDEEPDSKSLDEMTLAELKQYAKDNGIDIIGLTKKEDILNSIKGGADNGEKSES